MRPPVYLPPPRHYGRWPRRAINAVIMALGAIMGALVLIGYFGGQ